MSAIPLARLEPLRTAVLAAPGPRSLRRLLELGFVEGTPVRVLRRGPFGDPVELELRGYRVCVRAADLIDLSVRPLAGGEGA